MLEKIKKFNRIFLIIFSSLASFSLSIVPCQHSLAHDLKNDTRDLRDIQNKLVYSLINQTAKEFKDILKKSYQDFTKKDPSSDEYQRFIHWNLFLRNLNTKETNDNLLHLVLEKTKIENEKKIGYLYQYGLFFDSDFITYFNHKKQLNHSSLYELYHYLSDPEIRIDAQWISIFKYFFTMSHRFHLLKSAKKNRAISHALSLQLTKWTKLFLMTIFEKIAFNSHNEISLEKNIELINSFYSFIKNHPYIFFQKKKEVGLINDYGMPLLSLITEKMFDTRYKISVKDHQYHHQNGQHREDQTYNFVDSMIHQLNPHNHPFSLLAFEEEDGTSPVEGRNDFFYEQTRNYQKLGILRDITIDLTRDVLIKLFKRGLNTKNISECLFMSLESINQYPIHYAGERAKNFSSELKVYNGEKRLFFRKNEEGKSLFSEAIRRRKIYFINFILSKFRHDAINQINPFHLLMDKFLEEAKNPNSNSNYQLLKTNELELAQEKDLATKSIYFSEKIFWNDKIFNQRPLNFDIRDHLIKNCNIIDLNILHSIFYTHDLDHGKISDLLSMNHPQTGERFRDFLFKYNKHDLLFYTEIFLENIGTKVHHNYLNKQERKIIEETCFKYSDFLILI